MQIKTLITETLPLQGFRIRSLMRHPFDILIQIVPDRRFLPRCGRCGRPGKYRDTRPERKYRYPRACPWVSMRTPKVPRSFGQRVWPLSFESLGILICIENGDLRCFGDLNEDTDFTDTHTSDFQSYGSHKRILRMYDNEREPFSIEEIWFEIHCLPSFPLGSQKTDNLYQKPFHNETRLNPINTKIDRKKTEEFVVQRGIPLRP
jgi:hypothetical protein